MMKPKNVNSETPKLVPTSDLFGMILGLVRFPYPQVCRHYVALEILNIMEKRGLSFPHNLVNALSKSSEGDEEAERILLRLWPNEKADTQPNL